MNKIILSGFLGKDPELKKVSDKFTVCNFSIPYSEKFIKDGQKMETTHWFNCKAINQTAEFIAKYFHKGEGIEIEGKLLTRTWEKDGIKHYETFIQVDNVSFPPARKAEKQEPQAGNDPNDIDNFFA